MAIPDSVAAQVLAQCARHCCICRRFKPLHLHVHHIHERAESGSDEFDNLIATCVTCHSDIHTQTKLTRRFTERELKMHRDDVYRLVSEGKLPAGPEVLDALLMASRATIQRSASMAGSADLMPEAVEILMAAVTAPDDGDRDGEGPELLMSDQYPIIQAGGQSFGQNDPRRSARYRKAFQELVQRGLLEHVSNMLYRLTYDGWICGDELLAEGAAPDDGHA